jgi:ABC-type nitrate/sulfonate/bicarbonate transport system substrate-binding protein
MIEIGWRRGLAAIAALAVAMAMGPALAADKVKVSVPVFIPAYAMYFLALDKGYYKEEGLEVEIVKAGGGTATPALLSGDLQFTGSPGSAISAILRGAPLKLVFVSQDHPPYQIWSHDPAIKTASDLKGQRVGVISRGDTHELSVRMVMMAKHLDPNAVSYVPMGFGPGRIAGVTSGALAAASLTMDEVAEVQNDPALHMVADTSRIARMVVGGAASSDRVLHGDRALAIRFLRAVIKGRRLMLADPDAAIDAVLARSPKTPRAAFVVGYKASTTGATKDGTVPLSVQRHEIDVRAALLNIAKADWPAAKQVFDFSLLDQINRELDEAHWKPKP